MVGKFVKNVDWDFNRLLKQLKNAPLTAEERQWLDSLYTADILRERLWTLGHEVFAQQFCPLCERRLPEYTHLEVTDQNVDTIYPQVGAHLDMCIHCATKHITLKELLTTAYAEQLPRAARRPVFDLSFLTTVPVPAHKQSVWQVFTTANATLQRLTTEIILTLGEPFARLETALQHTVLMIPLPVRDKEGGETIQMLNLDCPSANLAIRVGRGPVQAQHTMLLIDVLHIEPREPVEGVRISLYDQEHRLLERRGTDSGGNVCFANLAVGTYLVQVHHAGEIWEMLITLVP